MKEAFEAWAIAELMDGDTDRSDFRQDEEGRYKDRPLHLAYRAWQAACKWQREKDADIALKVASSFGAPDAYWIFADTIRDQKTD